MTPPIPLSDIGDKPDRDMLNSLQTGETTKDEAIALLGEPIGAILLAWAFLPQEQLTLQQTAGGALILFGVYLVARNKERNQLKKSEARIR